MIKFLKRSKYDKSISSTFPFNININILLPTEYYYALAIANSKINLDNRNFLGCYKYTLMIGFMSLH